MTPQQKLTGRLDSTTTKALPPVRQYRPINTGNTVIDNAHRQIFDLADNLRNNYGPTSVFSKGPPQSAPLVIASDTGNGNGFGVTIQLTREGTWLLTAACALTISGAGDHNQPFSLGLLVNNIVVEHFGTAQQAADGVQMVHQSWQVPSTTGSEVCALVIRKPAAATGVSFVTAINSTLSAFWQGA